MSDPSPSSAAAAGGRRFHLRRRLGAGAYGEVYLADMVSAGGFRRRVAVKLLHPEVARNRGAARRMRDEARILGHLAHRHIVSVLDLIQLGDRWAVVMDYLPGADLEQVLARCLAQERLPPPGAVFEIGAAVALALDAAWSSDDGEGRPLRVVHRDIKPSNIRLTPDGDVRVLDFGVARVDMENREAATREAGWIGTERFMAPERIALLGDSAAGDVYALGATLFDLLLGEPLGRTPVLPEKHQAMVDAGLARVRARLGDRPETDEVLAVLGSTVTAEPEDRPTARALAGSLDALARKLGGPSLRAFAAEIVPPMMSDDPGAAVEGVLTEAPPQTTVAGATLDLPDEPALPDDPGPRRWPLVVAVAMAAVAIVVLGGGLLVGGVAVGAGAMLWGAGDGAATDASDAPAPALRDDGASADDAAGATAAPVDAAAAALPADGGADGGADAGADTGADGGADDDPPAEPVDSEAPPGAATPAPSEAPPPALPRAPRAATPPSPAAVAAPAPDAPRIRALKVLFSEGSSLSVRCGDVAASGSTSVAMRNVPAGACVVEAVHLGRPLRGSFEVSRPSEVLCRASEGVLSCAAP